ncbi:MAG: CHASE3 domain-containing protein [Flavitalea sp.]
MKPKFAYLYISFIVSLAILVILSALFYQKLNTHLRYSKALEKSYQVIYRLKELEKRMINMETCSRGFMLIKDSSFLGQYNYSKDSINHDFDHLLDLQDNNSDQFSRLMLMKSTITNMVNLFDRNILRVNVIDYTAMHTSVSRGKTLMDTFQSESMQIEKAELYERDILFARQEFFKDVYPGYFNTILLFAGAITLISFYFINREVRMRWRYQAELENKLHELNRTNAELEQFAYVASHDLQEPLRKIRLFGDRLSYNHLQSVPPEISKVIERMNASALRMQELIQDMVNFTTLIGKDEKMDKVNMDEVVQQALVDIEEQVNVCKAIIHSVSLPVIIGIRWQLSLLFKSLFDNAFKFSKPGEPPVIQITYSQIEGTDEIDGIRKVKKLYHRIVVEDKGIGFDNEFADRIFMIFQRLHTQQSGYRGKGIGLAIAQRIMANHSGLIMAKGMINDGAAFIMYFPV